jgi:serine protease AprX
MHVGDLDATTGQQNRWKWYATVTITLHDADHNAVSNAIVYGEWSGGYAGSASCVTDASGQCSITSGTIFLRRYTSVTYTVSNVTHASMTYTSADNHDPDGDSDGTVIVVNAP